jgi:hypothetical protein
MIDIRNITIYTYAVYKTVTKCYEKCLTFETFITK